MAIESRDALSAAERMVAMRAWMKRNLRSILHEGAYASMERDVDVMCDYLASQNCLPPAGFGLYAYAGCVLGEYARSHAIPDKDIPRLMRSFAEEI